MTTQRYIYLHVYVFIKKYLIFTFPTRWAKPECQSIKDNSHLKGRFLSLLLFNIHLAELLLKLESQGLKR